MINSKSWRKHCPTDRYSKRLLDYNKHFRKECQGIQRRTIRDYLNTINTQGELPESGLLELS